MKKPVKTRIRRWVTALRSGKFQQGIGSLRPTATTWCCLGVACKVFQQETGKGKWNTEGSRCFVIDGNSDSSVLPLKVAKWFGCTTDPNLKRIPTGIGFDTRAASTWNDRRTSFCTIADMIEKRYLKGPSRGR
jgi:hypothetical protein